MQVLAGVVANDFNLSTMEAEVGRYLEIPGQPRLLSKTQSQKGKTTKQEKKKKRIQISDFYSVLKYTRRVFAVNGLKQLILKNLILTLILIVQCKTTCML